MNSMELEIMLLEKIMKSMEMLENYKLLEKDQFTFPLIKVLNVKDSITLLSNKIISFLVLLQED